MARSTSARSSSTRSTSGGGSAGKGGAASARRRTPTPAPKRQIPWGVIAASAVVVLFAAGIVIYAVMAPNSSEKKLVQGEQTFGDLGRNHTEAAVTYPQVPPVGGNHNPAWLNCGTYDQPVKNEN